MANLIQESKATNGDSKRYSAYERLPFEEAERIRRNPPQVMTLSEASAFLGVSPGTIRNLTYRRLISVVKVGGCCRYRLRDLETYLEGNLEEAL